MMFKVYRFSLKSGPFPQRASNLVDSKTFAKKKERLWGRRQLRPFGRRERCCKFLPWSTRSMREQNFSQRPTRYGRASPGSSLRESDLHHGENSADGGRLAGGPRPARPIKMGFAGAAASGPDCSPAHPSC